MSKLDLEKDAVQLVPATATASVYKAWHELPGQNGDLVKWMETTGYETVAATQDAPSILGRGGGRLEAFASGFLGVTPIYEGERGRQSQGVVKDAPWAFKPSKTPAPVTLIPTVWSCGNSQHFNRTQEIESSGD